MVITSASNETAVADNGAIAPNKPRKDNSFAVDLLARGKTLKALRAPWEYYWQEINDLVRPNTQAFQQAYTQGAPRTRKIYDGTAMLACAELAAGMQGFLCNPAERWFNVTAYDKSLIDDDDVLLWLEQVSDILYMHLSFPRAGFNPAMSEVLQDEVGYGTACMYSCWREELGQMRFRSFPLASLYIAEDKDGQVDTVFRTEQFTARQACQLWGEEALPEVVLKSYKEKPDSSYSFLHVVMPRKERNPSALDNKNMKWASYWVWIGGPPNQTGAVNTYAAEGQPEIVEESGYSSFPYQVPRWTKITGEVYGRSPGQNVMPDIKTINSMTRVILVAGEKIIDPPILIPDDGFVSPFKTVPGSIIKYEASIGGDIRNMVVPLETRGNVGIGEEMLDRYTERIERAFHIDQLRATRKKERQSVPEVQDDRSQQMQMLAPLLGRQEPELLGSLLMRVWDCVRRAGIIPPAPRKLLGKGLHLEFTSQAARAQTYSKAAAIPLVIQALTPLAQINESVMDVLDTDEAARQLAEAMDVTRKVIRSKRDIAAIRANRQQQQQQQQSAQNGALMASGAKDLATAHQIATTPAPAPAAQ